MTSRQEKLIENYIRTKVRSMLKESKYVDSAAPRGKPIGGKISVSISTHESGGKFVELNTNIMAGNKTVLLDKNGINELISLLKQLGQKI